MTVEELIAYYRRGAYTRGEVISTLIEMIEPGNLDSLTNGLGTGLFDLGVTRDRVRRLSFGFPIPSARPTPLFCAFGKLGPHGVAFD